MGPYRDQLRNHFQNNVIPTNADMMTDDMNVMYMQHLDEVGDLPMEKYFASAFDGTIEGGLLDLGEFGEAAEIRSMLREQAAKKVDPKDKQNSVSIIHIYLILMIWLGLNRVLTIHPNWPLKLNMTQKYPMSFFRQTPEMSTPGRTWIDPETEELTSTRGRVSLDPYTKTIGLPRLTSVEETGGFESGSAKGSGRATNRPFPMQETPGLFTTVPSLKDISDIVSVTRMGNNPVFTGIRGDPRKEPMWLRTPENAPENLHEAYLHEAQPASKLFDPFSLIPGHKRAEKHNQLELGQNLLSVNNMNAMMNRLMTSNIPTLTGSLDREGKPMTIDTGRGEIDVLDYMEDIYGLHGHRGSKDVDEMILDMVNHLSEKYDLPKEMLEEHFGPAHPETLRRLAENRFMHNAAKTSGMDFHPTRKIPFPRDEHGFPLSSTGEQMSGNALKLLGIESDKYGTGPNKISSTNQQSEVRHSRMPLQDEQVLLNPPTNQELNDLKEIME